MAYEYEHRLKNRLLDLEFDTWEETAKFEREYRELERVYRKAKAYDLLKEDIVINEHVFKRQADNDEISNIIHGHYVALLEQSKLEGKQND